MEEKNSCLRQGSSSAKVIPVVEVRTTTGDGTPESPYREITEYWSPDGVLLAISDPVKS